MFLWIKVSRYGATVFEPYPLPANPVTSVTEWVAIGGGQGLAKALDIGPAATIDVILASGLRGRGGAGFPVGRKWSSLRETAAGGTCFVACNGSEGEPGTFKDRALLRRNAFQLIEGVVIASFAIGAQSAFIGLKAKYTQEHENLSKALAEMEAAGLTAGIPITIVAGPDSYLFGEETALLQTIQGEPSAPRLFARHPRDLRLGPQHRLVGDAPGVKAPNFDDPHRRSSTTWSRCRPRRTSCATARIGSVRSAPTPAGPRHLHDRRRRQRAGRG